MGLLDLFGFGSNLKKSEIYKKRVKATPREPLKNARRRYLYSIDANEAMKDYYNDVASGKGGEDSIEVVQARLDVSENDKWREERRLRNFYKIDDPTLLLPDRTKPLRYGGVAFGGALVLGILGAAGLYIKGRVLTEKNYREAVNELAPAVDSALREDNLEEARKTYKSLIEKRDEWLPKKDYPDVWNKAEENERYLRGLERLLKARNKFGEAKKSAAEAKFAEALALLEDIGGVNALLSGVNESDLPEYKRGKLNELITEVKEFSGRYTQYRASFIQYNPIKNDLDRLRGEVAALDAKVKKGELFDLDKAAHVVDTVRNYLATLRNIQSEAVGKEALEKVVSDLRAIENSIESKEGLLTAYELIEFNNLSKNLEDINSSILPMAYLEDSVAEDIKKANGLLEKAKSDSMQVDNSRVSTFKLVSEIAAIENKLSEVVQQIGNIAELKLKAKSENIEERISAATDLTSRYFEKDFRKKKWDKVLEYLTFIPEPRSGVVEVIASVVDLETKLIKPEGMMFVRNGLSDDDLAEYRIQVDIFDDKKEVGPARRAVQALLNDADLEEGRAASSAITALIKARGELTLFREKEPDSKEKLEILSKEVEKAEIELKNALEKFGSAAKTHLESGERIQNPRTMGTLANLYHKLGKNDVADEYDAQSKQLKDKYKIE